MLPFFMLLNAETSLSQVQSLLQDKKYFNRSKKETSQIVSESSEISNFFNIACILVVGYLFDIFGRKALMLIIIILSGSLTVAIPWTSPNTSAFTACWISWQVLLGPMNSAPLLQDYVEKETFGRAVALFVIGMNVGMVVSLMGVLELVK